MHEGLLFFRLYIALVVVWRPPWIKDAKLEALILPMNAYICSESYHPCN